MEEDVKRMLRPAWQVSHTSKSEFGPGISSNRILRYLVGR